MTAVRILGISGSHRQGATEYCVKEALAAAREVPGVTTDFSTLRGKQIGHCIHCDLCVRNKTLCVIKDDFQEIQERFMAADGFIIGTPVYQMSPTPLLQDFFSRTRPIHIVYPGLLANRVGGAIATGGTRHGGQEMAILVVHSFMKTKQMLVTGGPGGNYMGASVWTGDRKEEGAREDEVGMQRVRALGQRVAEASLMVKAGREALDREGFEFKQYGSWFGGHMIAAGPAPEKPGK